MAFLGKTSRKIVYAVDFGSELWGYPKKIGKYIFYQTTLGITKQEQTQPN